MSSIGKALQRGFAAYLTLERGVSAQTVEAYGRDLVLLDRYLQDKGGEKSLKNIVLEDLQSFLCWLGELGIAGSSQARIVSGIKNFFKYALLEGIVESDPSFLLEGPRQSRYLPEVLSYEEIQSMIDSIDLSVFLGHRNKAMLETLYACGLRVSELVSLEMRHLYEEQGFVKVVGKGNKERIVPIGRSALRQIEIYRQTERKLIPPVKNFEDCLFLNRRGKPLTRGMVFQMVKSVALQAGIPKNVSPHTFRHSFATHLVEGGADLRAVQDMLGHESITTTEIYTHLDTDYLRETLMSHHPMNIRDQKTKEK
jgi:integrase/recombinase XerD